MKPREAKTLEEHARESDIATQEAPALGAKNPIVGKNAAREDKAHRRRTSSRANAKTVLKDLRLGPRQADVTHWRCRRLDEESDRRGVALFWGDSDDGIEVAEWPIKECSSEIISERWGPGRYVVDYMRIDDKGKRTARGTSRVLHIAARKTVAAEEARDAMEGANKLPGITSSEPNFSSVFSLLAYLEDRNEKARSAAAAEARYAIDRAAAEAKSTQERYRADLEFQLERERLASKERIAQIEASARHVPTRGGPHVDPELLATRIGDVVGERIEEALEAFEPPSTAMVPAGAASPDTATTVINALKDTLGPLVALLAQSAIPPLGPGGSGTGGGPPEGGRDPKKEPN